MRLSLNGATIMRAPLEDDVPIAAEAGFSSIEIWAGKLDAYLRGHTLYDLRAQMTAAAITPWCINSIEDISPRDAAGRREVLARLEELSTVAHAVGAPSIVVVPGRAPEGFARRQAISDAVEVLSEMARAADGVGLAFEFLGKPGCSVPTLDMATEIIERVDRPNAGMVIDTFHFHAGGSAFDDIARVPVDRLLVVHVNGCEDRPRDELTDAHRLYPGEGAIPIDAILTALRARGFDGVASVEIFRPAYWDQDPLEVARTAHATALAVLERAGYEVTS